jgi:plasmid stabilization system protein ParE
MAKVRWTAVATRELRGIVEYAVAYSRSRGVRLAARIDSATDNLAAFPRLGRMVPDYQRDEIRELIVDDYRLIYRLVDDEVRILTILHGSRDLLRHLPDGPWDIQ